MSTVVTQSFVLNVTGLLDPTLKCIDNFDKGDKVLHPTSALSKSAKKQLSKVSNVLKVNSKDTRTTSGASIVNFEHKFGIYLQFVLLLLLNSNK